MGYKRYEEVHITLNNKIVKMINSYGFFAAEYVHARNLPKHRMSENWLSRTECKIIKRPVTDDELLGGIVGFSRAMHGYYALYERILTEEEKILLNKSRNGGFKKKFKFEILQN